MPKKKSEYSVLSEVNTEDEWLQLCKKEVSEWNLTSDLFVFRRSNRVPCLSVLGLGRGRRLLRLERSLQRHDQLSQEDEARGERRSAVVRHGQDGRHPAAQDLPGFLQAHLALHRLRAAGRRLPRGERPALGAHDPERDAEGEDGHERREGAPDHRVQRRPAE